jgi:hypothetical protein
MKARIVVLITSAYLAACAGPTVRPALSPAPPKREALLVLPGFGYGRTGGDSFRALTASMAGEGVDLYVPTYVTRSGLADSREKLRRFIHDNRLDRYERLHVFAFLAGGWTLNPLLEREALPNLVSVIYDRSPFQERAPKIAATRLPALAWLRYGSTVFDVARTPYQALDDPDVKVALMVETVPTSFIKKHADAARQDGPFDFSCGALGQRYDDCLYLPLSHDQVYARFADVWPEVRMFIRTGHFSGAANRTPPIDDPLPRGKRQ